MEKFGAIRNPLTIIAVFAGVAEVFGTGVLPFISSDNQRLFIWFLMVFPAALVVMFFGTLNWNHSVLYAPSDFRDESLFVKLLLGMGANVTEVEEKTSEEVREIVEDSGSGPSKTPASEPEPVPDLQGFRDATKEAKSYRDDQTTRDVSTELRSRYIVAERLALQKISKELGIEIHANTSMRRPDGRSIIFDGMGVGSNGTLYVVEVKYFVAAGNAGRRLKEAVARLRMNLEQVVPNPISRKKVVLIFVAVTAPEFTFPESFDSVFSEMCMAIGFNAQLRVFSFDQLQREFA